MTTAALGLAVFLLVLHRLAQRESYRCFSYLPQRLLLAGLLVAAVVQLTRPDIGLFESSSAIKRVAIPVMFVLAVIALLSSRSSRERGRLAPMDLAFVALAVLCLFGAVAVVSGGTPYLQDLGLFALFICAYLCGRRLGTRTTDLLGRHRQFIWTALTLSCIALLVGWSTAPFASLAVPAICSAFILSRERGKSAGLVLAALLLFAVLLFAPTSGHTGLGGQQTSASLLAQLSLAVLLIGAVRWTKIARLGTASILVIATIGALIVLQRTTTGEVIRGEYVGSDVTLAQRSYEKVAVDRSLVGWRTLLGNGMGATVDLSASPDALTLRRAGRALAHVDDVHLITAEFRMKFGDLGLLWLLLYTGLLAPLLAFAFRSATTGDLWPGLLVMWPVMALVDALPAATSMLANPLPALLLGMLVRHRVELEQGHR